MSSNYLSIIYCPVKKKRFSVFLKMLMRLNVRKKAEFYQEKEKTRLLAVIVSVGSMKLETYN